MNQRQSRRKVLALLGGLLLAGWARAASVTVTIGPASGAVGSTVKVPVLVRGAQGLGALQMDLVFDPAVLSPQMVEPGALLAGLVDSNAVALGRLRIAMATSQGVTGDGELLVAGFKVLAAGQSPLTPEVVRAWEQASSVEMMVTVEAGTFTAGGGLPMAALAATAAALLAVIALVMVVARSRRSRPAAAPAQARQATAGAPPPPAPAPPQAPTRPAAQQPTLFIVAGERSGQEVRLAQKLRVGRAADNDLCLPDGTVSSHHAEIVHEAPRWVLKDLGSTNGTFHNGARVSGTVELHDGDAVGFGDCRAEVSGLGGG